MTKREYGCALRQRARDAEAKAENELEARERGKLSTATLGRSSSRGKRRRKERDQWDMEAMIESGDWPDGESAWQEGGEEAQECGTTFRRHLLQVATCGCCVFMALKCCSLVQGGKEAWANVMCVFHVLLLKGH